MRLRWLWAVCAVVIGCSTLPSKPINLNILDCQARDDCFVVVVDNAANRYDAEIRINGVKYGDIGSYGNKSYSLYADRLRHGNCAVVTAKLSDIKYHTVLYSDEQCIYPGQYFDVRITLVPLKVWLTPFRIAR